ncbi:UDP-N-acetylmuramoyl-L-alanyl-D-glutamate--2,6-diaminopimelate ligase [Amnibacterium sp. CER49]|uniref:Mur ligase family protein n=1 Tax=Amnibacterium sp. CER49 TaxID=3039161 RepID=UPI00244A1D3D|nr:UDP-N-acetylmuramoyl-L-alanyl-D-glutamate--2,6-diaminopimelate ligase [Amnibacterium sp. CER49]MDH2444709.1 UDP-N-acetylmuramoyl-L-alanyl-D-glutamate--2,6-diaminopimelate ligase [Amnibacterium sp. CER49]
MGEGLRPEHPVPRSLARLAEEFGFDTQGDLGEAEVEGVSLSSKGIEDGDLYVALQGRNAHGAAYAADAVAAGATGVLTDPAGAALIAGLEVPVLVTADPRAALGAVASFVYRTDSGLPQLYAVTGTNGKTSVVHLLDGVLQQLGILSALTSTAERRVGDVTLVSSLTTPEASDLHAMLARMKEAGVRAAAVEVSAQALSRHRVDGVVFDVAGFTNLSHDHLDDYGDLEEYFAAKLALFDPDRASRGVVLVDGEWGRRIADESRIPIATVALGDADADWHVEVTDESADRTAFTLHGPDGRTLSTSVPFFGAYMAANAALAIVMLVEGGIDLGEIDHVLTRDGGIDARIPGRIERLSGARGPAFYLDYGHTPDAFETTLKALRKVTPGRVVMVFGADGDRDRTKRADMGAIAAREADAVVITDFHPRSEDPATIRAALLQGARAARPEGELHEVPDPREAVRLAVRLAGEGDSILYAGPGHENYREVAGVKLPYSARSDARVALQEAGWEPAYAGPDEQ